MVASWLKAIYMFPEVYTITILGKSFLKEHSCICVFTIFSFHFHAIAIISYLINMSRKKCIETMMLRKKGFHPVVLLTQIIAAILHKKLAFETRSNLTLHFSQAQCTHTQWGEINSVGEFLFLYNRGVFSANILLIGSNNQFRNYESKCSLTLPLVFIFFVKSSFIG